MTKKVENGYDDHVLLIFSHIYPDRDSLVTAAVELACRIAKMSPVAVSGTKHNLNYSRDHTVRESLEYMVSLNK